MKSHQMTTQLSCPGQDFAGQSGIAGFGIDSVAGRGEIQWPVNEPKEESMAGLGVHHGSDGPKIQA
jgi:hypothetical protein